MSTVLDEIIGPDVVGPLGAQTDTGSVREPETAAFGLSGWNLQPLASPDPRDIAAQIVRQRGVSIDLGPLSGTEPALMDERFAMALTRAAEAEGHAIPQMACGVGHDAAIFANHGVPTAMLFIRNAHGSHNPRESMEIEDLAVAARLLMRFCLEPGSLGA